MALSIKNVSTFVIKGMLLWKPSIKLTLNCNLWLVFKNVLTSNTVLHTVFFFPPTRLTLTYPQHPQLSSYTFLLLLLYFFTHFSLPFSYIHTYCILQLFLPQTCSLTAPLLRVPDISWWIWRQQWELTSAISPSSLFSSFSPHPPLCANSWRVRLCVHLPSFNGLFIVWRFTANLISPIIWLVWQVQYLSESMDRMHYWNKIFNGLTQNTYSHFDVCDTFGEKKKCEWEGSKRLSTCFNR